MALRAAQTPTCALWGAELARGRAAFYGRRDPTPTDSRWRLGRRLLPDAQPAAIPPPRHSTCIFPPNPQTTPLCALGSCLETAVGRTERCDILPDRIVGRHEPVCALWLEELDWSQNERSVCHDPTLIGPLDPAFEWVSPRMAGYACVKCATARSPPDVSWDSTLLA